MPCALFFQLPANMQLAAQPLTNLYSLYTQLI